ncbi:MAG: aminoacyl--tRNA ligase-related protein [Patescibacteria group bacterium]
MRLSKLFTRTTRENPADEVSVNAQLLERGGFVYKNSAGIYTYMPLGFRVLEKIKAIIREEMNAVGGTEMLMPALIDKKYYEAAGRADIKVGFKTGDDNFILGWSHEEILTAMAGRYTSSYHDLPFAAYQFQTKFRNEARAKSGLLRGREFLMKDMYSFHADEGDFLDYYAKVGEAYRKIFERCGLKAYYTVAAGGDFTTSNTHEFQVLTKAGEDLILLCPKCSWAINTEIADEKSCPKCGEELVEEKSIEVGNIFPLGTKYSEALNLQFTDAAGEKKHVVMGCYGIGLSRVLGTVVEVHHDDRGMIWPRTLAPFRAHLIALPGGEQEAEKLYDPGSMLYDDRPDKSAGEKFADADLIGCPIRLVVSKKTLEHQGIEVKKRGAEESKIVPLTELAAMLQ